MSNILLITSSPRGTESLSARFAGDFARRLRQQRPGATLTVRDLYAQPPAHIDEAYIVGRGLPADTRTPAQAAAVAHAEALIAELHAADTVVIGSGMINFGPPTQLRAWFDYVAWPGVTFRYVEGKIEGLLGGKKTYLVTASGGVFSNGPRAAVDFQSNYLKYLLGLIGLTDIEHMRVEGLAYGPDAAKAAIDNAQTAVQALLAKAA
ncbi:FMN-dependent NADH-azoreductase [Achromobacter aloeverae]|uniref:FMN dependent NADH:quinone oxidoreductase n=1 Tax=Achromobacter aloeverae TaxID=1750518 RepID=A0A4Q1HN58_9BURK|nr:NAD(P)H-dependent oxidoreductase [Achromobacter aloeverae]RXN92329.1 FMN-dependent NADH-azoreductase [Achromobacter aloeverae]